MAVGADAVGVPGVHVIALRLPLLAVEVDAAGMVVALQQLLLQKPVPTPLSTALEGGGVVHAVLVGVKGVAGQVAHAVPVRLVGLATGPGVAGAATRLLPLPPLPPLPPRPPAQRATKSTMDSTHATSAPRKCMHFAGRELRAPTTTGARTVWRNTASRES